MTTLIKGAIRALRTARPLTRDEQHAVLRHIHNQRMALEVTHEALTVMSARAGVSPPPALPPCETALEDENGRPH